MQLTDEQVKALYRHFLTHDWIERNGDYETIMEIIRKLTERVNEMSTLWE